MCHQCVLFVLVAVTLLVDHYHGEIIYPSLLVSSSQLKWAMPPAVYHISDLLGYCMPVLALIAVVILVVVKPF